MARARAAAPPGWQARPTPPRAAPPRGRGQRPRRPRLARSRGQRRRRRCRHLAGELHCAAPRALVLSMERFRIAFSFPGVALAAVVQLVAGSSMAGLEQTFRLFTLDDFGMSVRGTGTVLGVVGVVLVLVQAVVLRRLARVVSERALVRAGLLLQATAFAFIGASPRFGALALLVLYLSMALNGLGSGLVAPSLSALVSRFCDARSQGVGLGVLQSAGALARVLGPPLAGLLYGHVAHGAPYFAAALGMLCAALLSIRLRQPRVVAVVTPGDPEGAGVAS
ncbi:MAG: MFS transporter [Polyangiaceae bacterium]